jgi:hypothetical protein
MLTIEVVGLLISGGLYFFVFNKRNKELDEIGHLLIL